MQDWITGVFAVLGTLMVLAGATLIVLRALGRSPVAGQAGTDTVPDTDPTAAPAEPAEPATGRAARPLRRLSLTSQLIVWGVVLLVLAAFTAELVSFAVELRAGNQ